MVVRESFSMFDVDALRASSVCSATSDPNTKSKMLCKTHSLSFWILCGCCTSSSLCGYCQKATWTRRASQAFALPRIISRSEKQCRLLLFAKACHSSTLGRASTVRAGKLRTQEAARQRGAQNTTSSVLRHVRSSKLAADHQSTHTMNAHDT